MLSSLINGVCRHSKGIENKKNYVHRIIVVLCLLSHLFGQFQFVGLGGKHIESLRMNGNYLYAASDNGIYRKSILVSDTNWTAIGLQSFETKALLVLNPDSIIVSVITTGMGSDTVSLFKTIDGGTTWLPSQNGFGGGTGYNNQILDLDGLSYEPDTIFATGYAQVAKSTDLGITWSIVWGDWHYGGMGTHFVKIDPQATNIVWAGGESGFFQPYVHKSTDFGNSWQENFLDVGGDNACYSIAINPLNSDEVYVGMEGRIIKTIDGGTNWNTIFIPANYPYFFGLAVNSNNPTIIYAVGSRCGIPPSLYKSEDSGTTWTSLVDDSLQFSGALNLIYVYENNLDVLYFGTVMNGVYKYIDELSVVDESDRVQFPFTFILNQNFPNPFNISTTFPFTLFESGIVNISIFDINGKLVETLFDEYEVSGSHSVTWYAHGISSGLYFYKISLDKDSLVKKCLI